MASEGFATLTELQSRTRIEFAIGKPYEPVATSYKLKTRSLGNLLFHTYSSVSFYIRRKQACGFVQNELFSCLLFKVGPWLSWLPSAQAICVGLELTFSLQSIAAYPGRSLPHFHSNGVSALFC